jgi:hypothetical protein
MGTPTSTGAMPTSTAGMDMGGMDMGGGGDASACKISVSNLSLLQVHKLKISGRCCGIGTAWIPVSRCSAAVCRYTLRSRPFFRPTRCSEVHLVIGFSSWAIV